MGSKAELYSLHWESIPLLRESPAQACLADVEERMQFLEDNQAEMLHHMSGAPQGPGPGHRGNPGAGHLVPGGGAGARDMTDMKAKTILKEAVDAVVNSFAKHTHGYGRGKSIRVHGNLVAFILG